MLSHVSDPVSGAGAEHFWQRKNQTGILQHVYYENTSKNQAEAETSKVILTSPPSSVAPCPIPPISILNNIHEQVHGQTHFALPQAHCTVASKKKTPEFLFLAKGTKV